MEIIFLNGWLYKYEEKLEKSYNICEIYRYVYKGFFMIKKIKKMCIDYYFNLFVIVGLKKEKVLGLNVNWFLDLFGF